MGAIVVGDLEAARRAACRASEPVGDLEVAAGPLRGTVVEADEVPLAIDELPLVALLGLLRRGRDVVRGAQELRVKESDRIAAVVEGLRGLGARHRGDRGRLRRDGHAAACAAARSTSRGDHRLAMLGAVAGLASREGVEVRRAWRRPAVSYPGFARTTSPAAAC